MKEKKLSKKHYHKIKLLRLMSLYSVIMLMLLISAVDADVPLSLCRRIFADSAMIRAIVVLPTPDGP